MTGYEVCQVHGGATPRGAALPQFKHGRYSKSLPARLAARYAASASDPRLLELNQEIALVDARLEDMLARVDTGESGAIWTGLLSAKEELLAARRANDMPGQLAALALITDLITKGHADYRAWAEVGALLEQRRRLVESENKRRKDMQEFITSQQALTLMGAIVGIIKEHVTDRTQLNRIAHAIDALALTEGGG